MNFGGAAWRAACTVFVKEIVDGLRDRRSLAVVLVSSVLIGPLVLLALSALVAAQEQRAERREVWMAGAEHAPSLVNFIERQTWTVRPAPADYAAQLRAATLAEPVLVVTADFEAQLARGEVAQVEIVSDAANRQAEAGAARVARLAAAFSSERARLALALRGVAPLVAEPIEVVERDLASTQARGGQLTLLVPFFVMLAVLYGGLHAALDTTAGERERASLEPLLTNPVPPLAVVLGKWAAVAGLAMLVATLSCASFLPGQWLLRSDSLQALFQYGPREALAFLLLLAPLAAALAALLMAVAIRCKSLKEAQASSAVLVLAVSLLPLASLFNDAGAAPWQRWVPALAQQALMARVLKGEPLVWGEAAPPLAVCVVLTALCLAYVARTLRGAAVR